jgi:hypothetical protein
MEMNAGTAEGFIPSCGAKPLPPHHLIPYRCCV